MSRRWIAPAAAIGGGLVLWHALAVVNGPLLLPRPSEVVAAFGTDILRLARATGQTSLAAFGGLFGAGTLGVATAMVGWAFPTLRGGLLPYTTALQIVPIVAIAPMLVVWLGYGVGVAMVTAGISSFFPVYSAASTGLLAATSDQVDLFRLYGASRFRELTDLRVPAALPSLFAGLRTAGGLAVIGAIVGEFIGSNGVPPALGQVIVASARSARMDLCFAAILCAGALTLAFHGALGLAERRLIGRWYGA